MLTLSVAETALCSRCQWLRRLCAHAVSGLRINLSCKLEIFRAPCRCKLAFETHVCAHQAADRTHLQALAAGAGALPDVLSSLVGPHKRQRTDLCRHTSKYQPLRACCAAVIMSGHKRLLTGTSCHCIKFTSRHPRATDAQQARHGVGCHVCYLFLGIWVPWWSHRKLTQLCVPWIMLTVPAGNPASPASSMSFTQAPAHKSVRPPRAFADRRRAGNGQAVGVGTRLPAHLSTLLRMRLQ